MKDPVFLQIFLTFAFKICHFENIYCTSKKLVGTLADDIYLQSAKFEKILLSNMDDICVFVMIIFCIFAEPAIFRFIKILFLLSLFVFSSYLPKGKKHFKVVGIVKQFQWGDTTHKNFYNWGNIFYIRTLTFPKKFFLFVSMKTL